MTPQVLFRFFSAKVFNLKYIFADYSVLFYICLYIIINEMNLSLKRDFSCCFPGHHVHHVDLLIGFTNKEKSACHKWRAAIIS